MIPKRPFIFNKEIMIEIFDQFNSNMKVNSIQLSMFIILIFFKFFNWINFHNSNWKIKSVD